MTKPRLFVIAGCNGSGKSSFANAITPAGIESFDYDKEFLRIYNFFAIVTYSLATLRFISQII